MKLKQLCLISSLLIFISGCAPKLTVCGIDYPLLKAHCAPPSGSDFDLPLDQMEKYLCFSPDDFADLLRGVDGNITLCSIIDATKNQAYCNHDGKGQDVTLASLHKYFCLSDADLAEYERWYIANHNK